MLNEQPNSFIKLCRAMGAVCLMLSMMSCNIIDNKLSFNNDNDLQGARAAKAALMSSEYVNASPIRVTKVADHIELSGFVSSDEERSEAETIVQQLYPDATIINSIDVR